MKLRNKKTGEIREIKNILVDGMFTVNSLAELNEEWEDYEKPKEYWYLENNGDIDKETYDGDSYEEKLIEIGNYFETREQAEKVVEKLKAWKRLKDKGFEFVGYTGWDYGENVDIQTNLTTDDLRSQQEAIIKDLDLLFGGEE